MLYELFSFFSIVFNSYCVLALFNTINQKKFNYKKNLKFVLITSAITMINYFFMGTHTPIYVLLCILTYFVFLTLLFHDGVILSIFSICLFYILGAISELFFYYIYVITMGFSIDLIQKSVVLTMGPLLFTYFLIFIFTFIIKNTKSFTILIHQAKYPIVFLLTGASPIAVIIAYFTFLKYFAEELNREVLLFISITSVMLFLTLFIIFAGMYAKLLDQTFESKYNLEYANNVNALLTDLREFKHDFNNMLNGFKGCIMKGNIEDLRKYCEDFETSFVPADHNIYNLGRIQNPAVFGVFVHNLEQIKELHSDVNIMESVTFDTILDGASLCRVLGVILDNAIEAAGSSDEKRLIIDILADTEYTSVIIKNSFHGKLDLNNLHHSSKDEGRGTGLYSLEKILSKHKSIVHSFYIDDSNYFTQQLSIPNKNRAQ